MPNKTSVTITIYTTPEVIERIDQEIAAVRKSMPGVTLSRSSWTLARLHEHFRAKDARASKATR